jgi:hypothetical protein
MSTSVIICKTKSSIFPPTMMTLSQFIADQSQLPHWLRPCNDLQSQQMVSAYLMAIRPHLKNGGYIFVKRSRAADLFRQLTELGATYKAVHFKNMDDLAGILDMNEPKELWVIVEDDSLPYATLASRFKVAEVALRKHMAPMLGSKISLNEEDEYEKRKARGMILMMFIEMDYPSVKGFSIVQAQCRSLKIACCRVSRDNTHNHELNALFSEPEHSVDEWKSRIANTVRIYGSGPKHRAEMFGNLCNLVELHAPQADEQEDGGMETSINIGRLNEESRLGLAVGFSSARFVDLSR